MTRFHLSSTTASIPPSRDGMCLCPGTAIFTVFSSPFLLLSHQSTHHPNTTKHHPVLTHIHWIALFDVFLLLNPAVDIQSARLVFTNEMESFPLLQINNSASIGFHFTFLKWQEPHLYSTQLYRITEIASIVLSPAEYFTEETNRFSRALLFPNHGIKF